MTMALSCIWHPALTLLVSSRSFHLRRSSLGATSISTPISLEPCTRLRLLRLPSATTPTVITTPGSPTRPLCPMNACSGHTPHDAPAPSTATVAQSTGEQTPPGRPVAVPGPAASEKRAGPGPRLCQREPGLPAVSSNSNGAGFQGRALSAQLCVSDAPPPARHLCEDPPGPPRPAPQFWRRLCWAPEHVPASVLTCVALREVGTPFLTPSAQETTRGTTQYR